MEKIRPFIRPPWWTSSVQIHLENSKKDAKIHHDKATHDQDTICIYTDGSGIEGQIGAAAYCPMLGETKRQYLGPETLFNVFVAEVSAMTLATEIVRTAEKTYNKCVICRQPSSNKSGCKTCKAIRPRNHRRRTGQNRVPPNRATKSLYIPGVDSRTHGHSGK